jgi:predicted transcriptional regulator
MFDMESKILLLLEKYDNINLSELLRHIVVEENFLHSYITLCKIVKRLEEKDMIKLIKQGRKKIINLTDKGKDVAKVIKKANELLKEVCK